MLRIFAFFIAFTASLLSGCGGYEQTVEATIVEKIDVGSWPEFRVEYRGEVRSLKITPHVYDMHKTKKEDLECEGGEIVTCKSEIRVCWGANNDVRLGKCPTSTKKRNRHG